MIAIYNIIDYNEKSWVDYRWYQYNQPFKDRKIVKITDNREWRLDEV